MQPPTRRYSRPLAGSAATRCPYRVHPFSDQSMKVFSGSFRQNSAALPKWAALDQEFLRLNSALEYIDRHGNLDRFSGIESENLALMTTATHQGLVRWDRNDSRYELTSLARQRLGASRAVAGPTASAVPASPGSPTDARAGVFGS